MVPFHCAFFFKADLNHGKVIMVLRTEMGENLLWSVIIGVYE